MDEKVLDAAQELYELLLNNDDEDLLSNVADSYKRLRRQLIQGIGRDALPPFVRDGQTIDEAFHAIQKNVANGWNRHGFIRDAFDPIFTRLESGPAPAAPAPRKPRPAPSSPRIFISHRSDDLQLAQALVDLLVFSMRLEPEVVRCTSVPGHDLRGGERTDDRIRKEIADAEIFLALVTPGSLRSHFVLFELGARWGIEPLLGREPHFIPLIARGLDAGKLPRPLANFNCLDLREEEDVARLLAEMAGILGATLTSEAARGRHVRRVTGRASDVPAPSQFSEHERRILRALLDEETGRLLTWYRQDVHYGKALASLIAREMIREQNGTFVLRSKGRAAAAAYLASMLETE
ncbi:MAG TPA: toll/interleukin-1 receptor domain-containing protein [Thermoanaerobaculia bacterium]|nr:toll/interleukin-1 receptor domain-containing protein [Thermoanaerobaculia bacterium]